MRPLRKDSDPRSVVVAEPALDFARAVARGLSDSPKWLPCRFLYDARGSALFEEITELPEYYQTRVESSILERNASAICVATGPVTLIELGSGSSQKTGHLLAAYAQRAIGPVRYIPVDVSETALRLAGRTIEDVHPEVEVSGIVGTYQTVFPMFGGHSPCLVLFLGSTIGNFNVTESVDFWNQIADSLPAGDHFLLGVDLVKNTATLEAAYNDAAGVSGKFTKNLFARINHELGADIDLDRIEHVARYNTDWQRIEIFARFLADQQVRIQPLDTTFRIRAGETVMTEISRKFVLDDLRQYVTGFGFEVVRSFTDDRNWFGVLLLRRREE